MPDDAIRLYGYKLAEPIDYLTNRTKLNLVCSNGHGFSTSFRQWKQGVRCNTCKKLHLLPCWVYYLQFDAGTHKIGMTYRTIDARWGPFGIRELKQLILCKNDVAARRIESAVVDQFAGKAVKGSKEHFTEDVLEGVPLESFAKEGELLPFSEMITPAWSQCFGVHDFSRETVASEEREAFFERYLIST